MNAPDCTGRHDLFPTQCPVCPRLLPVTGERHPNPILPDVKFLEDGWECLSFKPDHQKG